MRSRNTGEARLDIEAAEWLARLSNPDSGFRGAGASGRAGNLPALEAWLRRSPDHVQAFMDASEAFHKLEALSGPLGAGVRELLESDTANVVPLRLKDRLNSQPAASTAPAGAGDVKNGWWLRRSARLLAAAGLAVVLVGSALLYRNSHRIQNYATHVGEQRTIKLDDGSLINLNTKSRITVDFSGAQRHITLLEGEALFTVERDANRPFLVHTDMATVRAVGTAFNVYRRSDAVQVAVVEGRVQLSASSSAEAPGNGESAAAAQLTALPVRPVLLDAGEEANVANGRIAKRPAPLVSDAIAWRGRQLIFHDTPLGEVAAQFNRYNKVQIRIEDASLRARPLAGVFSADHPQSLILYLTEYGSISVAPEGDDWVVRTK